MYDRSRVIAYYPTRTLSSSSASQPAHSRLRFILRFLDCAWYKRFNATHRSALGHMTGYVVVTEFLYRFLVASCPSSEPRASREPSPQERGRATTTATRAPSAPHPSGIRHWNANQKRRERRTVACVYRKTCDYSHARDLVNGYKRFPDE